MTNKEIQDAYEKEFAMNIVYASFVYYFYCSLSNFISNFTFEAKTCAELFAFHWSTMSLDQTEANTERHTVTLHDNRQHSVPNFSTRERSCNWRISSLRNAAQLLKHELFLMLDVSMNFVPENVFAPNVAHNFLNFFYRVWKWNVNNTWCVGDWWKDMKYKSKTH